MVSKKSATLDPTCKLCGVPASKHGVGCYFSSEKSSMTPSREQDELFLKMCDRLLKAPTNLDCSEYPGYFSDIKAVATALRTRLSSPSVPEGWIEAFKNIRAYAVGGPRDRWPEERLRMIASVCDLVLDAPKPPLTPSRSDCPYCGGNDADMPCAYPSENKPGCLRDKRLAPPLTPSRSEGNAIPDDPSRAIAKLLAKLDDEDKATFNWLMDARRVALSYEPSSHHFGAVVDAELKSAFIELHKDASEKLELVAPNDDQSLLVLQTRKNAIQDCINLLCRSNRIELPTRFVRVDQDVIDRLQSGETVELSLNVIAIPRALRHPSFKESM